jgi:transcriptional regulator with XRE-family HTH domain/CheY-like chemotaxis protein
MAEKPSALRAGTFVTPARSKALMLRAYRQRLGLTQEDLAGKAEMSVRGIANIERGQVVRPHPYSLAKLADVLGMTGADRDEFVRRPVQPDLTVAGEPSRPTLVDHDHGGVGRPLPVRQLPTDVRDFTGRDAETREIEAHLKSEVLESPPVAVMSGQGGIGKTALAIHIGHRLSGDYSDGQLFADLGGPAHRQSPSAVLARLLRALGVDGRRVINTDLGERSALFRSIVAVRHLLIVLDNAADEAQVRPLLPGSGRSATIVTSRTRLAALESARTFDLPLLDLHESELLFARVISARRAEAEVEATRAVLRACGGLPLAVRIAGARLAARLETSISDLARELRNEQVRLDRLIVGDLAVRMTIEVGYEGLREADRRALKLSSLIGGGDSFSPWMLAAVTGSRPTEAVATANRLTDSRLFETAGIDPSRATRYRLHDLVRLYANERLRAECAKQHQRSAVERLLGSWLLVAEAITEALPATPSSSTHGDGPRRDPGDDLVALIRDAPREWFWTERKNAFAAVRTGMAHGFVDLSWQVTDALVTPCLLYGDYELLGDAAAEVLSICHHARNIRGTAAMTSALALIKHELCEWAEAFDLYRKSYGIFADLHDLRGMAVSATFAVDTARAVQQYEGRGGADHLTQWSRRATDACRALGSPSHNVDLSYVLGKVELARGEPDSARRHFEACRHLAARLGKPVSQAHATYRLGMVARMTGRPRQAIKEYTDVLAFNRAIGDRTGVAHIAFELATLLADLGELRRAAGMAEVALGAFRELGIARKTAEAQRLLHSLATAAA